MVGLGSRKEQCILFLEEMTQVVGGSRVCVPKLVNSVDMEEGMVNNE